MIEEWKVWKETIIPKFNNERRIYEISNYGRLKINGELIDLPKDNIRIYLPGNYKMHRVVIELFIGPIPKGYVVDHIDGNPSNNNINNLRVCTQKENIHNPITFDRYLKAMKVIHKSEEYRQKQSIAHIGKKASLEAKKNMSKSHKGEKHHFYGKIGPNANKHRVYNEDGTYNYVSN